MTWDFRKEINMNINEISVAYLKEKEQRRRASTVDGYRSSINLYILPEFGDSEIETIESEAIQSWVDSFGKPGAAEKAFKCLRQLFNWAIRKYRLRIWNPTNRYECCCNWSGVLCCLIAPSTRNRYSRCCARCTCFSSKHNLPIFP